MIQRELNVVQVEGELEGVEVAMSIDKAAEHLIMERLIRLYTNPILAFVREMSTNARDAVIEAGNDAPIEVTLPTNLAPVFIVRDAGVGMAFEDIISTYSKYGASTKRHSNDFNGALGFGCKSPLAYTPLFTVQSVKNGHRVTLQVGRTPQGGGKMTVVEGGPDNPTPTTENTGTTVIIPVNTDDIVRVHRETRDFFLHWKPGTVLVNGEQPEHIEPLLRLTDNLAVIKGNQDLVLMANVAYPTPSRLNTGLADGYALLAEVPTSDVDFTPSREALEMTPYTRARVDRIECDFRDACKGAIQTKITAAGSRSDALSTMVYWRSVLPKAARSKDDRYVWNRKVLPAEWRDPKLPGLEWPFMTVKKGSWYGGRHSFDSKEKLSAKRFARDIFVVGFGATKFSANHHSKLSMWRQDVDSDGSKFVSVEDYVIIRADEIPRDVRIWIDPARIVQWEHVKKTYKLPSRRTAGYVSGSRKAIMGSYDDVWIEDGNDGWKLNGETEAKNIRTQYPVYYYTTQDSYGYSAISMAPVLHKHFTVVKLPMNRVEKFKRDFPQAKSIFDAAAAAYAIWRPSITQDMLDARVAQNTMRYANTRAIKALDLALVKDPAIKRAVRLLTMDLTEMENRERIFRQLLGPDAKLPAGSDFEDPMTSYPLVNNRTGSTDTEKEHMYLYLNAVYAANTTP